MSAINTFQNLFIGRVLQGILQLIENHIEELLCILLDRHIDRKPTVVLEAKAELLWVVVLPISGL